MSYQQTLKQTFKSKYLIHRFLKVDNIEMNQMIDEAYKQTPF